MRNLKPVLLKFQSEFRNAIVAGSATEVLDTRLKFINDIKSVSCSNRVFLWINVVMLIIVFAVSLGLTIYFVIQGDMTKVGIVSSVSGISISGLIYYMTTLWQKIVAIDLTLALVDRLDSSALPAIIGSLLTMFGNKSN